MVDIDDPPLDGPEALLFTADGSSALTAEVVDGVLVVVTPPEQDLLLTDESEGVLTYPVVGDAPGLADDTAFYDLDFGTEVPSASVDLEPVLLTTSGVVAPAVAAGGSLDLSLPSGSSLRGAGVASLEEAVVVLDDLLRREAPPAPGVEASADAVRVTLDGATEPGDYRVAVLLPLAGEDGGALAQRASVTSVELEVTAAPASPPAQEPTEEPTSQPTAAPTRPATNPGLRSNTGVEDAGAGREGLLVGGGLALVAAAGATALAARRRTAR